MGKCLESKQAFMRGYHAATQAFDVAASSVSTHKSSGSSKNAPGTNWTHCTGTKYTDYMQGNGKDGDICSLDNADGSLYAPDEEQTMCPFRRVGIFSVGRCLMK